MLPLEIEPLISKPLPLPPPSSSLSFSSSKLSSSSSNLSSLPPPTCLIMGRTGAGKTTLYNNLCGTTRTSGTGKNSFTRDLACDAICHGDYPFRLIDTPGTNTSCEAYKHAYLLRSGLTLKPLNTIFVVLKYENRFDTMYEYYLQQQELVFKYDHKIVIMISHWDNAKDPAKEFSEICETFEDISANIICYSMHSDINKVAHLMYSCAVSMAPEVLEINQKEFFLTFNISDLKGKIHKEYLLFKKAAETLFNDFSNSLIDIAKQEADEVLPVLMISLRDQLDKIYDEFVQNYRHRMDDLEFYTFAIKMQREHLKLCDRFAESIKELISYNLFDKKDPRNCIKRCPYCQTIWFKTEGCDGVTMCGNREFSNFFDISYKPAYKYEINWIRGNKVTWVKNSQLNRKHLVRPSNSSSNGSNNNPNKSGIGCGSQLTWSALPPIEQELLFELFKVRSFEELKNQIDKGKFINALEAYEANIKVDIQVSQKGDLTRSNPFS